MDPLSSVSAAVSLLGFLQNLTKSLNTTIYRSALHNKDEDAATIHSALLFLEKRNEELLRSIENRQVKSPNLSRDLLAISWAVDQLIFVLEKTAPSQKKRSKYSLRRPKRPDDGDEKAISSLAAGLRNLSESISGVAATIKLPDVQGKASIGPVHLQTKSNFWTVPKLGRTPLLLEDDNFEDGLRPSVEIQRRFKPLWRLLSVDEVLPYWQRHAAYKRERLDGTCKWALDHQKYVKWISGDGAPKFLQCYGRSGSGKSIITSMIVDDVRRRNRTHAFFYLAPGRVQTGTEVLLHLLEQLCSQVGSVPACIESIEPDRLKFENLPDLLMRALDELSRSVKDAVILFDAWDHQNMITTEDFDHIIRFISKTSWKLYTSSRTRDDGGSEDLKASFESGTWQPDLEAFARDVIRRKYAAPAFKYFDDDESLTRAAVEKLATNSRGVFFWIVVQLDLILQQTTRFEIQSAIEALPADHNAIARTALETVDQQSRHLRDLAQISLLWLSNSQLPLTIDAIREALALATALKDGTTESLPEPDRLPAERALWDCWKGLATIDSVTHTVALRQDEFRDMIGSIWKDRAIPSLGEMCLSYLLLEDFHAIPFKTPTEMRAACSKYKCLTYAARCWVQYSQSDSTTALQGLTERLLRKPNNLAFALAVSEWCQDQTYDAIAWDQVLKSVRHMSPLHTASRYGLKVALEDIMAQEGQAAVVKINAEGRTALHEAVIADHGEIVPRLLDFGASPVEMDISSRTPLHYAFEKRNGPIFDLLYTYMCQLWMKDPLHDKEHLFPGVGESEAQILNTFFDERHHLEHTKNDGGALCAAIGRSDYPVIVSLLCRGTNVNCNHRDGTPALHHAIYQVITGKSDEFVRLLLDCGANPSISTTDASGISTLHLTAKSGLLALTKLLLEYGADVSVRDNEGRTALFYVLQYYLDSKNEDVAIGLAQTLLKNRLNVKTPTKTGRQVLHEAAEKGALSLVRLLLQYTSDVDVADGQGKTPWQYANENKHRQVERLLLERMGISTRLKGPSQSKMATKLVKANSQETSGK